MGRLEYHREHLLELEEVLRVEVKNSEARNSPACLSAEVEYAFSRIDLTKRVIKFIEEGKV